MRELIEQSVMMGINGGAMIYGQILSIVVGVVLVGAGFYAKTKEKQWWIYLILVGVLSIIVNLIQLFM